jgi:hypothetical protein
MAPAESDAEWLWLLAHDNAPEPTALEQLLGAVEIAPSVAIAGPKLMRWDQPDVIAEFGETMTRYGAAIPLVDGELDQAQHDVQDDVLAVAANGMLVRRSLFVALGGFDPGLPAVDAALDFSVRARLAGFRVVVVPGAKVSTAGGPDLFGRRSLSQRRHARNARVAQLHRRLVYSSAFLLPFHWLSLLPLAIVRAIGQLLAKRPGYVGGELAAALTAAFTGGVGAARRMLHRSRRLGWDAIAPLRMPPRLVRERRAQAREIAMMPSARARENAEEPSAGFVAHGGLWVVVLAAVAGAVMFGPLLGAQSLTGGGLLPLSATVGELWSHVGYGWRDIGVGFTGPADPFASVLAILGSITFWDPSYSVVLLLILSLPLSALGAWFAARRITRRTWLPAVGAILWAVAPSLLGSVTAGHLGAVIAHLLLPWLILAALSSHRSWAAAAGAALLFAATVASAPVLAPALVLAWLAWLVSHPANALRIVGIPIPTIALFAPIIVEQFVRGTPLALLAEPGVPLAGAESSGWQLALGSAGPGLNGWTAAVTALALPNSSAAVIVAALLVPVGALALLALFVPGSRRAIPSLGIAFLGFLTAVIGSRIEVAVAGPTAASIWPGAALSLFWLGIVAAVLVALDAIGRAAIPLAALATVTVAVLAVPMFIAFYLGVAAVQPGSGRILPAFVTAQAQDHPSVGTLVIDPSAGTGIAAELERGSGTTLDDQSTLASTSTGLTAADRDIARIAGNLASRSGFDTASALAQYSIGFVLLEPAGVSTDIHQRTADALDGNPALAAVGQTANGLLWRVQQPHTTAVGAVPSNTATPLGRAVLIGEAIVFGLTLLLGIPTTRRRRRTEVSGSQPSEPAGTFDEDDGDD